MTQEDAVAFADKWLAAWNSHDLEAVLALFAEDAVFTSHLAERLVPGSGGIVRGKAALRAYWGTGFRANPGLRFTLAGVYYGVDTVAIRFLMQDGAERCEILTFSDSGLVVSGHGTAAAAL